MNKMLIGMFIVGAGVGAVGAWLYLKKKYEQIAQEEIDSVKNTYAKRNIKAVKSDISTHQNINSKPNIMDYAAKLQEQAYVNYSTPQTDMNNSMEEKKRMDEKPYIISPDEFGEIDNYEKISLTYYNDQILTDDNDDILEDIADIIGKDSLEHFGEYEDDSVFVRNDIRKCDYEILKDFRNYSDVVKHKPVKMEDKY